MQRTSSAATKRTPSIDSETVLRHAQTPIDPAELARRLDVPHATLGRTLRRLVESERLRWVWDDAGTNSLCLDARVPCPDGYTEGVQGARLRDRPHDAGQPHEGPAAASPAKALQPAANDTKPHTSPAATPRPPQPARAQPADDRESPPDPATVLTDVVRQAGRVRRHALARSGAARTGLSRSDADALIDALLDRGQLVETQGGSTRWLTVGAEARAAATARAPTPPRQSDETPLRGAVIDAVRRLGGARRDQVEAVARAPGVGGASVTMTSATDAMEAQGLIEATAGGRWTPTADASTATGKGAMRTVPADRLAAIRDQADLRTPVHEAILAAQGRTTGPIKLRDVADRTGLDVRALLRAAADLEAAEAVELSRDKRSPATVTIRAAWRNTRLCGAECGSDAPEPALDATAARALLVITGLGYATAADLDAPALRRRWDQAGHGAERALLRLRDLDLVHGPDRMRRWFPTDAGAAAEPEAARVVGRFRPDSLARRV